MAKTISAYDKEVSDAMRRRLRRSLTAVAKWCQRAPTCTNGPAAEDPQRQAPRPLPVLRPTDELSEPSEVLSGCRKDLEEVAQSPHAREPDDVGEIQTPPSSVSFAVTSDSTSLDVPGESCLRNPLREICTVGSVREEIPVVPWWTYTGTKLETRTQPRKTYSLSGLLYSERGDLTPTIYRRCRFFNNEGKVMGINFAMARVRRIEFRHSSWLREVASETLKPVPLINSGKPTLTSPDVG